MLEKIILTVIAAVTILSIVLFTQEFSEAMNAPIGDPYGNFTQEDIENKY